MKEDYSGYTREDLIDLINDLNTATATVGVYEIAKRVKKEYQNYYMDNHGDVECFDDWLLRKMGEESILCDLTDSCEDCQDKKCQGEDVVGRIDRAAGDGIDSI